VILLALDRDWWFRLLEEFVKGQVVGSENRWSGAFRTILGFDFFAEGEGTCFKNFR
jgi:hypothetical protein